MLQEEGRCQQLSFLDTSLHIVKVVGKPNHPPAGWSATRHQEQVIPIDIEIVINNDVQFAEVGVHQQKW
jgi:hypothetical protein